METIDIAKLVDSLLDWHTWLVIFVVSGSGLFGGLAHKLTSPPEDKTSLTRYIVVGIVASLAVLFIFIPKDPVRLIALSLTAGYGGKAILDALEARVRTAIAQEETAKAKDNGKEAVEAAKTAISYAQDLSQKFTKMKISLPTGAYPNVTEPQDDELKKLSGKLDLLEKYFQK